VNISQGLLPFQLIEDNGKIMMTSFAGIPLVMETFRALGLRASIQKHLPLLQRRGKYEEADYVESFVSVFCAGGDCADDFELLRGDEGLGELGLRIPSAEAARWFLNAFHEEEGLEGRLEHKGFIPDETALLQGLAGVNRDLVGKAVRQEAPWRATIDLDSTLIESHKREAYMTYLGERGYHPVVAYWAEQDLVVADEFRDGNVPAAMALLPVLQEAISALPPTVRLVRFRSDSAAYVHELLDWCRREIPGRPRIEFAISAEMSERLKAAIEALVEEDWNPLRKVTDQGWAVGRKEWAEVEFVPTQSSRKRDLKPDRYLAIRIRPAQGELFPEGQAYHYFAVATNMWSWEGEKLLRWQRERCGTVEKVHDVLKNDLAGGVFPSKRFFANATWWRLNLLAYNVLAVMKRKALPVAWWPVRLKALRFHLLCIAGRVIEHGRRVYLKIAKYHPSFLLYQEARAKLLIFSSA
jgi:Transposase DDE domain group 1